ncbi:MAG TPA: glycosyltransferase family 4 protein [Pyrinomonadaceae bacterium]|nr:glycosyltransferase family 4 protein [Pyrinomonadaceae bacterium]
MRVLGLCSHPREAAATRFRMLQFVEPLAERGIELDVRPFLTSEQFKRLYSSSGIVSKAAGMGLQAIRRLGDVVTAGRYDAVLVQREAMLFGPAFIEWLLASVRGIPLVLDLDDATYLSYVSPTYGRLGSMLKFFGKTDKLIRRSAVTICGNRFIAEYAEGKGARTVVIPTVVDLDVFKPVEKPFDERPPVVGWIGTHSTFHFLEALFPTLEALGEKHEFTLKIVGSGRKDIKLKNVRVECLAWSLEREVADFQDLDIGLYPIKPGGSANEQWINAKSGFKAIQYMAVGIPFVMSPVGVCAEVGKPDETHFNATEAAWYTALSKLLGDHDLRSRFGAAGREYALRNYAIAQCAETLAATLKGVMRA